jgi:hypothetical protein
LNRKDPYSGKPTFPRRALPWDRREREQIRDR